MGKTKIYVILFGALIAVLLLGAFFQDAEAEKYVSVTAEVKTDCTVSTHMYTEECLLKITDEVARSLAELVTQENVVAEETVILDTKREAFNQAAFNLQTIAN